MSKDALDHQDLSSEFTIAIKNPSRPGLGPFTLKVHRGATIFMVKQRLAAEYHGKPSPAQQTLIYGGRVLKEEQESLSNILQVADQPIHTLHLVVKDSKSTTSTQPASASSRPCQSTATSSSTVEENCGPSTQQASSGVSSAQQTAHPRPTSHPQQPFIQGGYGGLWPNTQPDPTMLAAYNAALESLRSRPPFPSFSSSQDTMTQISGYGPSSLPFPSGFATAQFVPPFSIPPTIIPPPQTSHSGAAAETLQATAGPSSQAAEHAESSRNGQDPRNGQLGRGPPQLYAPTLAYVPVNLVQSSQPMGQASSSSGDPQNRPAQAQQQGQPQNMLPYPQFAAPIMPMMMPFGFNPYGPHMMHHPANLGPPMLQYPFPQNIQRVPAGPQAPPPVAAAAAPEVPPGVVQAVLQPGGRLARPGMPAVRVRLIRINVKLLAQLAIMAFFVYQSMPRGRFFLLVGLVAAAYFLWPLVNRNNAIGRILDRLPNTFRNPRPAGVRAGAEPPRDGPEGVVRQQGQGILYELQALVLGFFASLLPGFNMNAEDAAAFAAAQQVVNQNEGREHLD